MEAEYTQHKLLSLLKMIPCATEAQLSMFFSAEIEPAQFRDMVQELVAKDIIKRRTLNQKYEVLMLTQKWTFFSADSTRDRLEAFWVIANMGADAVRWICQGDGPTRYQIITEGTCEIIDITVCETAEMARVGYMMREQKRLDGEEDSTNHVALVFSKERGEAMKQDLIRYKYDSYCVIGKNHRAEYYALED